MYKRNDEMVKLQHLTLIFIELCNNYMWAWSCIYLFVSPAIHLHNTADYKKSHLQCHCEPIQQHTKTHDKVRNNLGTITIPPTCRPLMKFSTEKSWYRKMSRSSWKTLDPNLNGYSDVINIWSRQNRYFKFLTKNWKFKLLSILFYCMAMKLI